MSDLSSLFQSYSFSSTIAEGIEILYSYNTIDPVIEYLDFGYSYVDSFNDSDYTSPIVFTKAASTQKILNNFPMWMNMRKDYTSVGSQLVNAWGAQLESLIELYNTVRKDQFLSTADQYYDIQLAVSELSTNSNKVYSPHLDNILFNSSFSMLAPKRYQKPLGWTVNRNSIDALTFDPENSIFGNHGVVLTGPVDLKQTRSVAIPASPLTYSIFVKTTTDTGLSTSESYDVNISGIILSIRYADNSVASFGVGLPMNTLGKWARASLSVSATNEIAEITAMIVNRQAVSYVVDCPLLEVSQVLGEWSPSQSDVLPYSNMPSKTVTGLQVLFDTLDSEPVKRLELFPLGTEQEFKNLGIPTRIAPSTVLAPARNTINNSYSRQIDFYNTVFPTSWKASNGAISESSLTSPDVFGMRYPADLILDDSGDLKLDLYLINRNQISVKAVSVIDNLLYVVTKETYASKSKYYLKLVRPIRVNYSSVYLPCLSDLELDIDLGQNFGIDAEDEDIVRIGICKNVPRTIYLDTTLNRRLYFELFFDYYYADFVNRKVYCRENYTKKNGHLQLI